MLLLKANAKALPLRFSPRSSSRFVAASARRAGSFFDDDPFFSSPLCDDLDREVADLTSRIASSEALPPAPVRSSWSSSARERESEQQQQQTTERPLPGGKGFARTRSSSGRTANSSWSSSESVVVWGVEPPRYTATPAAAPSPSFFFSPVGQLAGLAVLLYAAVAARFAQATREGATKYKTVSRWRLALLWPALAAFSPEFKEELKEALKLEKGRRKSVEEKDLKAKEAKEGSISDGGGGGVDATAFDER